MTEEIELSRIDGNQHEQDDSDVESLGSLTPRLLREPPVPLNAKAADSDDDDDESSDSIDGLAPIPIAGWAMLLLPFIMLTAALGIAYAGSRQDSLLNELDPIDVNGNTMTDTETPVYSLHRPQDHVITSATGHSYNISETAEKQIKAYRRGDALVVHVEVANHAGHAACSVIGQEAPGFDCWHFDSKTDKPVEFPDYYPWRYSETAANAAVVRRQFDFVSWKFSHPSRSVSLGETNWEDESILSLFIVRDPLTRMLAYDKMAADLWPAVFGESASRDDAHTQWWAFARSPYTDNFALRALTNGNCCHGSRTASKYLKQAKALIERFAIVLDMDCLDEGLMATADLLELDVQLPPKKEQQDTKSRIPADVYEYLRSKNRLDIELYEWAQTRSLVQCQNTTTPV